MSFQLRASLCLTALCALALNVPASAQITNGSFETGDFTGWTVKGFTTQHEARGTPHTYATYIADQTAGTPKAPTNAVVTQQTSNFDGFGPSSSPAINPTNGRYLAFLSNETSAGNGTLTGSSLSQTFVVPAGATTLSYDVQFLSNEAIGSEWDFGGVALLNGSTVLAQFNLDHQTAGSELGADANATATPAGGFKDSTGWLSESFNVAGLDGQSLTLIGYVTNTGDMSVESRLLLDNISVNGNVVTTPEPGTLALLVGSGIGGLLLRRRHRK